MSNTNTEVLTTAYEKLQGAITQANTVLPELEEAVEKGNLDNYATTSQLEDITNHKNEFINAKEVGADSTGNTDCSTLIQGYIDEGYNIFFPKGSYKCALEVKDNTVLKGESKCGTNLVAKSGATYVIYSQLSYSAYEIRNLTVNGLNVSSIKGIYFSSNSSGDVQDTEPIVNDVKIINCTVGMQVDEGIRGGYFKNINAGGCNYGIKHLSTDCIYDSCIACMNQYDGFFNLKSNNTFNNCKAFCNGRSLSYGAGFKNQGSFNRFINCESQQNIFENFYNQNANNNLIIATLEGCGWLSKSKFPNMTYPDGGSGDLVPISSFRSYNSKNNIITITCVNGRLDSYGKTAFYCQYQAADSKNVINMTTYNETSTDTFLDYVIDYPGDYFNNNDVKINGKKQYNQTYSNLSAIDSQVEIVEGGYVKRDDMVFVNIKVKALVTQSYGNEVISGLPHSLYAMGLSCTNSSKDVTMTADGKIVVGASLTTDEVFRITGYYVTNS